MLANHGAVSWGKEVEEAYLTMERLEFVAKLTILTKDLENVREISEDHLAGLADLQNA